MIPQGSKIIYVSREIERALGTEPSGDYMIVSNKTPYGESLHKRYPDSVTLIDPAASPKPGELLGTTDLLLHPATKALVSGLQPSILVFKNTMRVEAAAKTLGCRILNPAATLSERVENKLSQLRWLGPLGQKYLPPHAAKVAKLITWKNSDPFVIQWAHGHTGDGTILINTPDDLRAVQEKFPERMARVTAFVPGPSFTVNAVVSTDRILVSSPSYQITGLPPFTDNAFSTVGNDWGAARAMLTADHFAAIRAMAEDIGARLRTDGWKGLFGIDLVQGESGRFYLIEINARQPASTTFESALQEAVRTGKGVKGLTTFEAHLRALLGLPMDQDLIRIEDGAQIVQRVTKNVQSVFDDAAKSLEKAGHAVVAYQNIAPNSDLLRIQSQSRIIESHGSFNQHGREIAEVIKGSHLKIEV